jgi:hypothetical protein
MDGGTGPTQLIETASVNRCAALAPATLLSLHAAHRDDAQHDGRSAHARGASRAARVRPRHVRARSPTLARAASCATDRPFPRRFFGVLPANPWIARRGVTAAFGDTTRARLQTHATFPADRGNCAHFRAFPRPGQRAAARGSGTWGRSPPRGLIKSSLGASRGQPKP